jgi:Methane oxygenase PmoA
MKFVTTCCVWLMISCATFAAEVSKIEFTLEAGKFDRVNTPVKVHIVVPAKLLEKTISAQVQATGGQQLPAQVTSLGLLSSAKALTSADEVWAELHFVLPQLAAGKTLEFTATLTSEPTNSGERFAWSDTSKIKGEGDVHAEQSRELQFNGRPVLRYMHTALDESSKDARMGTYKPYHHVYDPLGKRYLTKGPGGVFPHHRGLYFGFNRISYGEKQTADTWHCNNGENESHVAMLGEVAGPVLGRHRVKINWNGKKQDTFAVETREMTVYNVPGGSLIEFASLLESQVGKVKLDGDPQHAGFQFRATQDVPDKTAKLTYYLRPDGKGEFDKFRNWPGDKQHANLPWNALSFVVDEQRYTCCYLDRPENPKEARFSERNYGRFGSYFEYELNQDHPLALNYRIWLQAGEMDVASVQRLDDDFVQPVVATLK